jgi:hypothetical protein
MTEVDRMPAAIAILARERLAWHALLDVPVGLTPSQAANISTDPAFRSAGAYPPLA